MKGSRLLVFLILSCFQETVQVKATQVNSYHQEEVRRTEAGRQQQKETIQQRRPDLGCRGDGLPRMEV